MQKQNRLDTWTCSAAGEILCDPACDRKYCIIQVNTKLVYSALAIFTCCKNTQQILQLLLSLPARLWHGH